MEAFVVFMGGAELKQPLEKIAAEKKVTVPLTVLPGGAGQPDIGAYKISPQAHNTVLLWNQGTVRYNFVNVDDKTFPQVAKAAADMVK